MFIFLDIIPFLAARVLARVPVAKSRFGRHHSTSLSQRKISHKNGSIHHLVEATTMNTFKTFFAILALFVASACAQNVSILHMPIKRQSSIQSGSLTVVFLVVCFFSPTKSTFKECLICSGWIKVPLPRRLRKLKRLVVFPRRRIPWHLKLILPRLRLSRKPRLPRHVERNKHLTHRFWGDWKHTKRKT